MLKTIAIFLILCSLNACYYNNEQDLLGDVVCDTTAVKYSTDVSQIISTNCLICHSNGSTLGGGIELEGYNNLKAHMGPGGRLIGAINHLPGYSAMPKGLSKLSNCDIAKIEKWNSDGAPNN